MMWEKFSNIVILIAAAITMVGVLREAGMTESLSPGIYSQSIERQAGRDREHKYMLVFATYAESPQQVEEILILAESLREFGGKFKAAPIWMYCPRQMPEMAAEIRRKLASLKIEVKMSETPPEASDFYYSGKVFAAVLAEKDAENIAVILVWLDNDTIILDEPGEFQLPKGINFGWRPVMHKLIGSDYSQPPDSFWSIVYNSLNIPESAMFPMETLTDHHIIRPYFNAGVLAVRPQAHIFRSWAESYPTLYRNPEIIAMAEKNEYIRIFLHQAALAAAVLNTVPEKAMLRLSDGINYPIFFKEMFGAEKEYDDLNGIVTIRYEYLRRNPILNWTTRLKGPEDRVAWVVARLSQ